MANKTKIPAIIEPGVGRYLLTAAAIIDEVQNMTQEQLNALAAVVPSLQTTLQQIVVSQGASAASEVVVTPPTGMRSTNVQDAIEELDESKADAKNAVFWESPDTPANAPVPKHLTFDTALRAYSDEEGHSLLDIYHRARRNAELLVALLQRIEDDEHDYVPKNLVKDIIVLYNETEILRLTEQFVDAKNLKSNGKDVLTEHQDISGKADKEVNGKKVLYEGDVYNKDEVYTQQEVDDKGYLTNENLGENVNNVVYGLDLIDCSTVGEAAEKDILVEEPAIAYKVGMSYKVKMEEANTAENVTANLLGNPGMPFIYNGNPVSQSNTWADNEVIEVWTDGESVFAKKWEPEYLSEFTQIGLKIGDLAELETTEKSNLVGAINEVNEKVSTVEGLLDIETDVDVITDFSSYSQIKGVLWMEGSGYFYDASGSASHIEIPISTGTESVSVKAGTSYAAITFLKQPLPHSHANPTDLTNLYLATGMEVIPTKVESGEEIKFSVPADAILMYVGHTVSDGTSRLPERVTIVGESSSRELEDIKDSINTNARAIDSVSQRVDVIEEQIGYEDTSTVIDDFSALTVYNGGLVYGGYLVSTSYGSHVEVDIPEGATNVTIETSSSSSKIAFLKQRLTGNLNSSDMPRYIADENTQGITLNAGKTTFAIPEGTLYLYVRKTLGDGTDVLPINVTFPSYSTAISKLQEDTEELKVQKDNIESYYSCIALFESIAVIGDSFSSGCVVGITGGSTGDHYPISWLQIMARRNGVVGTNYSYGGATPENWLARTTDNRGLQGLLADTPKKLYFIKLGINGTYSSLGSISDCHEDYSLNADSFYGNYGRIIGNIKAHAPKSRIICITNSIMSSSDRNTAIKEIASYYGVMVLDEKEDSFFTSDFYKNNLSGSHPIGVTYAGMATAYERLLVKCIIDNVEYFLNFVGD